MNSFLNKLLTFIILVRHPFVPGPYRWYIRFQWIGILKQLRFLKKDNLHKKAYKEIKFYGEFQQELLFVLPFAYWHYLNGTLSKTISCKDTKPFYFFSPNHEERFITRKWKGNHNTDIPNGPHNIKLSRVKWEPVPLKEHYQNQEFVFDKPIMVIANRYNSEWNNPPISYFDIPTLGRFFDLLQDKFQIIYNRPESNEIINDNSEIHELDEKEWIRQHYPETIILSDYFSMNKERYTCFNELQLKCYANSERFISIHGGTATLASYFGGDNVIFSKQGHEHYMNEFEHTFTQLSGARIHHVDEKEKLLDKLTEVFA